ncbi:T cell/B cell stimulating protein TspB, partial [Neisseria sp. N95_16]
MFHILERCFLKSILCVSFFISANAFAIENAPGKYDRIDVFDDGRFMGIRGTANQTANSHGRSWIGVFDRDTSQYIISDAQDLTPRYARTGDSAKSKVSAKVTASVSRSAVLAGAFSLAKRGAGILAGGGIVGGVITGTSIAVDAYNVVKADIESAGYQYDETKNEFLKHYDGAYCTPENV